MQRLEASFSDIKHVLFLRQRYHFHHTVSQDTNELHSDTNPYARALKTQMNGNIHVGMNVK